MAAENSLPLSSRWRHTMLSIGMGRALLAFMVLIIATLFIYRGIILAPAASERYPWASDTLGHVMKVEYLQSQLAAGHLYPDFFAGWYMGLQMLRYYPPLPYYVLAGLSHIIGNPVVAANWFIALCALAGGVGWLGYRRWIGWLPALTGGILYLFLPDHVRVALAEGNLPRVLANALLPFTVYFLLRALEPDGKSRHYLGLALCFALTVLSHAMMAAIHAVCCVVLSLLIWVWRATSMRRVIMAVIGMGLGLLLSGWWLLPSLKGGITELNASAMTEALAVFPLTTYLNPFLRAGDPEIVYPGAALLVAATLLLCVRRGRYGPIIALTVTGLLGVLITTPGFNALFNALPLHHLFWPLRFLGFASFALLLALMWRIKAWGGKSAVLVGSVLAALVVADGALSWPLIHLRPPRPDVPAVAERLRALPGWRAATLDFGRLGSAPTYFFTAKAQREQLYGWAYQGALTARNVAAIDEALQHGNYAYVIDRLTLFGVDDVVVWNSESWYAGLPAALEAAGYRPVYRGHEVALYHRDGGPRAYRVTWRSLGIGRGAQNLAFLFPQLIQGSRWKLDEYTVDELATYETLVLSGFQWNDRQRAEELVQHLAQAGVRVVVDLTGVPDDPMAREPYFLGVWGEHIALAAEPVRVIGEGGEYALRPFSSEFPYWKTHTPQGLDNETLYHAYLGGNSTVMGYKQVGAGQVWFVGLNLPYHAVLTKDPAAIQLLADVLELPAGQTQAYQAVPLDHYHVSPEGYRFSYTLDTDETLLVPVACHEGMRVYVDGQQTRVASFENLVAFDAPAGTHEVSIRLEPTPIYRWGILVTGLAVAGMIVFNRLSKRVLGERTDAHGEM